jgi:hypothetical protein
MSWSDAAVPSASLSLADPRPSRRGVCSISFDVYGALALAAASRSVPDMAAAARRGAVVIFFHGGGFAAGDKTECVTHH